MNNLRFLFSVLLALSLGSVLQAMDTDAQRVDKALNQYIGLVGRDRNIQSFYHNMSDEVPEYKALFLKKVFAWSVDKNETFVTLTMIKQKIDALDLQRTLVTFADMPKLLATLIENYAVSNSLFINDMLIWCIKRKAPVNTIDKPNSPLMEAISLKQVTVVQCLLSHDVNLEQPYLMDDNSIRNPITYIETLDTQDPELITIKEMLIAKRDSWSASKILKPTPIKLFGVVCVLAAVAGGIAYWWNQKTDKATEDADKADKVTDTKQVAS